MSDARVHMMFCIPLWTNQLLLEVTVELRGMKGPLGARYVGVSVGRRARCA